MKYLKLFEQFEDEEDAWWERESLFDEIEVGDKVRCIRNMQSNLILNKIYVVREVSIDSEITYLKLVGMDGDWNSNRFKKIIKK